MQQQTSSNHMDKSIIILLLSIMVISVIVVVFKAVNHDPCQIVNFDTKASQYRVGEIIRFKDYTEDAKEREWEFGDSTETRYTQDPFHTYSKPGTYNITLTVNGKCSLEKKLVIKEKKNIIDSTRLASFEIPNTIKVGELLTAFDKTKKATSWEWRFGETSEVNSIFQNPTYTYQTEGLKTITLIVNGDPKYSSQKKITVLPKVGVTSPKKTRSVRQNRERESIIKYDPAVISDAPPGGVKEEPKKPTTPKISRSAFAKKIIKVGEEKATANDFKPYLCGNLQVTTMDKGKKTTFIEFCEKIKGKKLKIKSLEIFKNESTGCIEYVSIDYSKSFF